MKTRVIIEKATDNSYSLYIDRDDLKIGLYGYSETIAKAKEDFMTTYNEAQELYPDKMETLDFEFIYNVLRL